MVVFRKPTFNGVPMYIFCIYEVLLGYCTLTCFKFMHLVLYVKGLEGDINHRIYIGWMKSLQENVKILTEISDRFYWFQFVTDFVTEIN